MRQQLALAFLVLGAASAAGQEKTTLPEGALTRLGVHRLRITANVHATSFGRAGDSICALCYVNGKTQAIAYDLKTGFERKRWLMDEVPIAVAQAQPLALVNPLDLWDLEKGERIWHLQKPGDYHVGAFAVSPDGKRAAALAVVDAASCILRWDLTTGKALPAIKRAEGFDHIQFSQDGSKIFIATYALYTPDGAMTPSSLVIWDASTGKKLLGRRGRALYFALSSTADRVAEADGSSVNVVDLVGKGMRQEIAVNSMQLAFSPDGRQLTRSPPTRATAEDASRRRCAALAARKTLLSRCVSLRPA